MTNKQVYQEIFSSRLHQYDDAADAIYYYPCDDLHGMFSGHDCNCKTRIERKYLSQEDIDSEIVNYEAIQKANANLYAVSVNLTGNITIARCARKEKVSQDVIYQNDRNYTMYCTEDKVDQIKNILQKTCIDRFDDQIKEAETAKQEFVIRFQEQRNRSD